MGVLRRLGTDEFRALSSRHTVGRSTSCSLHLPASTVSGIHAVIEWLPPAGWYVRDLGSKNGTFLSGRRVEPQRPVVLRSRARISFGGEAEVWELHDGGPPAPVARSTPREFRFAENGLIALPDGERPDVTVFIDGEECLVEDARGRRPVRNHTSIAAGGTEWTLLVPELLGETRLRDGPPEVARLELEFKVSRDEEHVEIDVTGDSIKSRLANRAHSYLLLTLARIRVDDSARSDLPEAEQGWVDRESLEKMLRVDTEQLNLLVFRARRQLAELGIPDAIGLVERRSGSRQLRIGIGRLRISSL